MTKKKTTKRKTPKHEIAGHKAAYTREKKHAKNSASAFRAAKKRAVDSALKEMGVSPKKYWDKKEKKQTKKKGKKK